MLLQWGVVLCVSGRWFFFVAARLAYIFIFILQLRLRLFKCVFFFVMNVFDGTNIGPICFNPRLKKCVIVYMLLIVVYNV